MAAPRPRARVAHLQRLSLLFFFLVAATVPRVVLAEKVIAKGDDWQVYTDGRVAGFLSWVYGDGAPVSAADLNGGKWELPTEPQTDSSQGTVNMMRLRSGFIGNQLGFGVRGQVTPWTTVTGYIQLWAYIESEDREKGMPNPPDVRQGYAKLEGLWGSFLAGRTRTLFSRGATDINVMYAHRWGIGFPNKIDKTGPTQGMVGFGVMGSGFGAGMIYGTPVFKIPWWLALLLCPPLAVFGSSVDTQLNVGIFDPAKLGGPGWNGTKYPRAEYEWTFEKKFGETGKVVLFEGGVYQKVYKPGQCVPAPDNPCDETVLGLGYGGRFELGPVRLGAAGYYGKGLGMSYALENSYAVGDAETHLRWSDGYYLQAMLVVRRFDFFGGLGIARLFMTDLDKSTANLSVLKYQMGINGGIVFNVTPNVHLDLEYFRAAAKWWLGESQILHCAAFGMTFNW